MGKGSYDEIGNTGQHDPRDLAIFTIGVVVSQVIGLIMIILVGTWMGSYHDGYGWDPAKVFNYHPLLMTIGMIFLYGDAMLVYRIFRNTAKLYVKILHALIHIAVLVFASIALKAVFDSHNKVEKPIPNMYSLHSWIGLTAVVLFSLQWVAGFVSFLFPKLSESIRRWYLPHHKFMGLAIFVLCLAAALMGITEKAIFALNGNNGAAKYSDLPSEGVLLNFFGLTIATYGGLVIYLVTKFEYIRPAENN